MQATGPGQACMWYIILAAERPGMRGLASADYLLCCGERNLRWIGMVVPRLRTGIIEYGMTTKVQTSAQAAEKSNSMQALVVLVAGWLVPGVGHFLLKKWIRGSLLLVSIASMFAIGLALKGKIYSPNTGDLLDILNFAGDLGNGLFYLIAKALDLGQGSVQIAVADYGTKFIVVAGLLNVISAVDAHSLATGRKRS